MPKIPDNARATDLAQTAKMGRDSGFLSRVGQAVRYAIRGVTPDTWMSPGQPVQPTAQEGAYGRRLDYGVGQNLFYKPRGTEVTSFAQLRALADNCDIIRLCIETRKDQMERQRWKVQLRDEDQSSDEDPKAKAITQALRRPDGDHTWNTWMRMLLEEVLVIDAASVLPRKKVNGAHAYFELIDGSTIKPLIDGEGRKPIAPSPAYQQVIKGLPAVDYTSDELIYRPRNPRVHKFYGYSPVEQVMLTINIAIRRALNQLEYFTEGTMPGAYASVPKDWTPQQIEEFQQYWDSYMEDVQSRNRKTKFTPGDTKVTNHKEPPLKDDFDEWIARVCCYAFSLSPTPFVKMMNRATADTAEEAALEEGLSPIKEWFKDLVDYLIETCLGEPNYEFVWQDERALDPVQQQTIHTAYLEKGVLTLNEVRKALGKDMIDGGDEPMIITRTGAIRVRDAAEGSKPEVEPPTPQHEGDAATGGAPQPANPDNPDEGEPVPAVKKKLTKASTDPPRIDRSRPAIIEAEKKIREAIASGLELSREEIVKQITTAAPEGAKPADIDALVEKIQLEGLVEAHADVLAALTDVAKDGAQQGLDQLNIGDENMTAMVNEKAVDFAKQRAADLITSDANGGELIKATRDMIRKTVTQAIDEGWSNDQLSHALQDDYAFSRNRADLIARTETAMADSRGNMISYIESGVVKEKRWILDPDPCPVCIANADQGAIPLTQAFTGGVQMPPQHPNCRCEATPIIED